MPMGCGLGNMRCLIAVMLACVVAQSPARAQPVPASPVSSIRVSGDARITARPDRVQIDIGVSTRAVQSQEAASQCARQVDAVLAAVRKATGPAADLKTISYSLNPTYQYHPKGEEPTLTGYSALDVVRAQALREAATRARAEVDVLAATLGLKVVRVLSVEENSPRVIPVRAYMAGQRAMASAAAPTPVEAGTLDVSANVLLTVEVSPTAR